VFKVLQSLTVYNNVDTKTYLEVFEGYGNNQYQKIWDGMVERTDGSMINANYLIDAGDLDGDGLGEFLVGGVSGGVGPGTNPYFNLFESNGENSFTLIHRFTGANPPGQNIQIVDIDNDGIDEVVMTYSGTTTSAFDGSITYKIFKSNGDNSFEEIGTQTVQSKYSYFIGAGDYDVDGKNEIYLRGTNELTQIYESNIEPSSYECSDGIDNDGNGCADYPADSGCSDSNDIIESGGSCPAPVPPSPPSQNIDSDGDGFSDYDEVRLGTDPFDNCGLGAWPLDFVWGGVLNSTNRINIVDLTSFLVPIMRLGTNVGDPDYDVRWDLVEGAGVLGTDINIQDLIAMITGPTAYPPMLGGAKAFDGPSCK